MIKFPARSEITERVLAILNPDYTADDLHDANVTWWKNIRSTGGYGLTYAGSQAFEKAEIEFQEFDEGPSGYMANMSLSLSLDAKMVTPYYFYSHDKRRKVKIYDGRIAMVVTLYETVGDYLKTLDNRQ
jgi:hypothetical protein